MFTEQLSQALSVGAAKLDPVSQAAGTVTTGGLDMSKFNRAVFLIMVGAVTGSVDAKLQECTDTAGTSAADITGASITTISTANKIAFLEIRSQQLSAGKSFVRLSLTVTTGPALIAVVPLGGEAAQKPASAQDIAAVIQKKVV